jgi:hypothetical protein
LKKWLQQPRAIGAQLQGRLQRDVERLVLVESQLAEVEKRLKEQLHSEGAGSIGRVALALMQLCGIGVGFDAHTLQFRQRPARAGDQQSREPPGAVSVGGTVLAVVALSAGVRLEPMVPGTLQWRRQATEANRHRGRGAPIGGGVMALHGARSDSRRGVLENDGCRLRSGAIRINHP